MTDLRVIEGGKEGAGEAVAPQWVDQIVMRRGTGAPVVANVITILTHDDRWAGVLAYDLFAERVVKLKRPPWPELLAKGDKGIGDWQDEDDIRLSSWLSRRWNIDVGLGVAHAGATVAAREHPIHPVRDWLLSLDWDGQPRIDALFVDCFGAEDSPYMREVGRSFMIGAVARAFEPGCKVDTVPILEGAQGIGKSSGIRALAGNEWFCEFQGELNTKGVEGALRRKWIAELCELDSMSRAEVSRVRAFITTQTDTFRAAYGRLGRDYPRQFVFIGTTNASTYLKDDAGNRRFYPVRCRRRVDLALIRSMREQLWAEAWCRWKALEPWHVSDPALAAAITEQQEQRRELDPWLFPIDAWVNNPGHPRRRRDGVTTADVLSEALKIETGRWTRVDEMRVGSILRQIGLTDRRKARRGTLLAYVFRDGNTGGNEGGDGGEAAIEAKVPTVPTVPTQEALDYSGYVGEVSGPSSENVGSWEQDPLFGEDGS